MSNDPKIILFDLEIIPDLKEALKVWPGLSYYPGLTLKATITSIICAGWKVFGQKKTHCVNAWDFKEWKKDVNNDYQVVKAISDVLEGADAVVTHNGIRFDMKFLQTRLMKHKLPPLPKIHHIDTCKLAKANLYALNNKLNTVGELLVGERKLDHEGWDLWVKVHNRDPKAMAKMEKYCKQDVDLLEKVFKPLRPFAKNIPNYMLSSTGNKPVCPTCGSTRLRNKGYVYNKTTTFNRYRCKDCLSYSRTDTRDRNPRSI
jgi:hypothetical protein